MAYGIFLFARKTLSYETHCSHGQSYGTIRRRLWLLWMAVRGDGLQKRPFSMMGLLSTVEGMRTVPMLTCTPQYMVITVQDGAVNSFIQYHR